MTHTEQYMREVSQIAMALDWDGVERMAQTIARIRYNNGRLFLIGLGGSAANCSHAAADFRTICEVDAYSLTDSMAEFSAKANDRGFDRVFVEMLSARKIGSKDDAIFVMSVGGGTETVSKAITDALPLAVTVLGIVGPKGGSTFTAATNCIRVSAPEARVTPHSEAFQAVIWHCLVSHPLLQRHRTKW